MEQGVEAMAVERAQGRDRLLRRTAGEERGRGVAE